MDTGRHTTRKDTVDWTEDLGDSPWASAAPPSPSALKLLPTVIPIRERGPRPPTSCVARAQGQAQELVPLSRGPTAKPTASLFFCPSLLLQTLFLFVPIIPSWSDFQSSYLKKFPAAEKEVSGGKQTHVCWCLKRAPGWGTLTSTHGGIRCAAGPTTPNKHSLRPRGRHGTAAHGNAVSHLLVTKTQKHTIGSRFLLKLLMRWEKK